MKNLKVVFALVIATIFMLTSCQKEQMSDMQTASKSTTTANDAYLTGEELPIIETYSKEEISLIREEQMGSFAKEAKLGTRKFTANNGSSSSRSRTITDIACGDVKSGTTRGETNTVDIYPGADKVYLLEMSRADEVDFKLSNLRSDLDLFIAEVIVDNYGRQLIGNYLKSSDNEGNSEESFSIQLDKGAYFVIVETYEFGSDFQLSVKCRNQGGNTTPADRACEDYQSLSANYNYGIAAQSNHWNLWTNNANDGLVLHESAYAANKVVKFDNQRFGYQDVVRDIIGLPLTRGYYFMNFDLFVANNSIAEMLTEKTANYGQEQGFYLKVEGERLNIEYKGRSYTARTRIPSNTWHNVAMAFDLQANEITVLINGIRIIMRANGKIASSNTGRKSVQGINFFGSSSKSKFHIDNVCIEEVEPGYDSPIYSTTGNSYGEVIDLR